MSLLNADGRSPIRPRQLHDLRLLPTADDPRPMFVWSTETPRDFVAGHGSVYPKLLWHGETGVEVTAHDEEEERAFGSSYVTTPPSLVADPVADLAVSFEGLSESDREFILKAQQTERLARIQAKLANLSEAELERVIASASAPKKTRKAVA